MGVLVEVGVEVWVGVSDGVKVSVTVGVSVIVGLGVKNGLKQTGEESILKSGLRVLPYSSYIFTYRTLENCLSVAVSGWTMLYELPLA